MNVPAPLCMVGYSSLVEERESIANALDCNRCVGSNPTPTA